MPIRPLATALALALVGCVTVRTEAPGLPTSTASRLAPSDAPELADPPPPPTAVPAAAGPVSGAALRRRLVQFVAESQAARDAARPGDPMPGAQLARWEEVQTETVLFLGAPASAEDLSAVRAFLQAVFDLDAQAYPDLPEPFLQCLDARLGQLDARLRAVSPGLAQRGAFRWPLSKVKVTSRFGRRLHPIKRRWKLHSGVDLAADPNEPVVAAGGGMVVLAGWNAGNGYEVEIQHGGGLVTRYSHLAAPLVLEGTPVQAGDALGLAGRTGTATGVHLHFEFVRGGVPRDPLREFRKLVEPAPKVVVVAPQDRRRDRKKQDKRPETPGA